MGRFQPADGSSANVRNRRNCAVATRPGEGRFLTCFDGAQTFLVSVPRLVLDDYARQRGWGPLAPSDQNFVIDSNRTTLLPLIQWSYDHGGATQRTNRQTGRIIPLITLLRSDLGSVEI